MKKPRLIPIYVERGVARAACSGKPLRESSMNIRAPLLGIGLAAAAAMLPLTPATAEGPDVIFKKSTVWRALTPNDRLAVYGVDDPLVDGVACHYTVPERGGVAGAFGVAEEVSDISLACRQIGPVSFKGTFEQGETVFTERRSLVFKRMRIVRGCDAKRNVLVYLVYSDRPIEGSPKNSTSTVPIMPWGDSAAPSCADALKS
jgi:CreA protein